MILEEFSTIFDRPEKIKKLREYIIDLAIKGEFSQNIENKNSTDDLPKNWKWVTLGEIGNIFNGNSINKKIKETKYSKVKEGYNYIATKDVDLKTRKINYENGVKIPYGEPKFKIAHKGAVLICSEGGSAGRKIGLAEEDICFGNKLLAIEPIDNVDSRYIYYIYQSRYFFEKFSNLIMGIIGGISIKNFKSILIPLPPLEEQKIIIKKLDYLMELCVKLEDNLKKKEKNISLTANSILNKIDNSKTFDELKENLLFLIENFKELSLSEEIINNIKNTILGLGIRGKLVEQNPNDESAEILLEKVKEEKEKSIKEKKIKRNQAFPNIPKINDNIIPYELPKGWKWVRITDIMAINDNSIRRGPFGSAITKDMFVPKGDETYKIYEQKNAIKKDWKLGDYYISKEHYKKLERFNVTSGDIIISCAGTIGETYILPNGIEKGIINQALLKIRLNENIIDNMYFINVFKSLTQKELNTSAKGSAMKNLVSVDYLKKNVCFPLPPINEQKRIVEKINSLMALCDELEKEINNSKQLNEMLMVKILEEEISK